MQHSSERKMTSEEIQFFNFNLNKVILYLVVGMNLFMCAFFICYVSLYFLCWKLQGFSERIQYFYDYLQVRQKF